MSAVFVDSVCCGGDKRSAQCNMGADSSKVDTLPHKAHLIVMHVLPWRLSQLPQNTYEWMAQILVVLLGMKAGNLRHGIYQSLFKKMFCSELDMPFAKWTKEQVCNWLQDQGLGSYISNGRHWILSGQTLLQASQQDLEKVRSTKNTTFSST